jgi:hypothetical protein
LSATIGLTSRQVWEPGNNLEGYSSHIIGARYTLTERFGQ